MTDSAPLTHTASQPASAHPAARWIWSDPASPNPKNRLTYFRKAFTLDELPADATLRFAADSNARLWINGQVVRRKVARYNEEQITAEVINAAPYLRAGANVIVALHHNWGQIITFQRSANCHAGLYLAAPWLQTDASWRCLRAPEFAIHEQQIIGTIGDDRIRYPQVLDQRAAIGEALHKPDFDDSAWAAAILVDDGPWPAAPADVETPGQREYPVAPLNVLAAGHAEYPTAVSPDEAPGGIASRLRLAALRQDEAATVAAGALACGPLGGTSGMLGSSKPCVIDGEAGQTFYMTFDFGRPVHGYPYLALTDAPAGTIVDFGYAEIVRAQYNGKIHVTEDGWINPEGVVGPGYADRVITRAGKQAVELPDERTARWLTVHVHFPTAGRVTLTAVGIVKSQYPIQPRGSFACGDERMEQIVKLYLTHAEVTMTDSYVDTPGREDGQWLEDAIPRASLAARWFGDIHLRRLLIRTAAQSQGADGNLHPFAPANFPAYPSLYDWSVQWVAALYEDYVWTGDTELARRYFGTLSRYWATVLSHVNADGLWQTARVFADIRAGLHCDNERQSSGVVTPWIIERLRWSAELARALGETEQADAWTAVADRMTTAFRRDHLVPASGEVPVHVADRFDPENPAYERGYSQPGQTIAVSSGLLTPEEAQADLDYAFPDPEGAPPAGVERWNNPTYGYRVLRALSDAGRTPRAVRHLLERYAPYLPAHPRNPASLRLQGSAGGPLPEYWISREDLGLTEDETNRTQPADDTGSHGWGAVPLLWLHDTLLGVRITQPGGGRLRIAPEDGGLPFVAGHTMTPKGTVWICWEPLRWRLEVTLPTGVIADVVMPPACQGKRVRATQAAGPVETLENNEFRLTQGGAYVFEVW